MKFFQQGSEIKMTTEAGNADQIQNRSKDKNVARAPNAKDKKRKEMYSYLCLRHILKLNMTSKLVSMKRITQPVAGLYNLSLQKLDRSFISHFLPVQSMEKYDQWEVHPSQGNFLKEQKTTSAKASFSTTERSQITTFCWSFGELLVSIWKMTCPRKQLEFLFGFINLCASKQQGYQNCSLLQEGSLTVMSLD